MRKTIELDPTWAAKRAKAVASSHFLFCSKGSKEGKKLVITLESSISQQPNTDLMHILHRTNHK